MGYFQTKKTRREKMCAIISLVVMDIQEQRDSVGTLLQLYSVGMQDTHLTYMPEFSHFNQSYEQHMAFGFNHEELDHMFPMGSVFGSKHTFVIPRKGSYLGNISLQLTLGIDDVTMDSDVFLALNAYGIFEMIDKIVFRCNNKVLDELLPEHVFHEFGSSLSDQKRIALTKMLRGEKIDSNTIRITIPLPFWFCNWNPKSDACNRFPLASLDTNLPIALDLCMKDKSLCQCITTDMVSLRVQLWVDYIVVSKTEENLMMSETYDSLIETHSFHIEPLTKQESRTDIPFQHVTKKLSWGFKPHIDISNVIEDVFSTGKDDRRNLDNYSVSIVDSQLRQIHEEQESLITQKNLLHVIQNPNFIQHHFTFNSTLHDYIDLSVRFYDGLEEQATAIDFLSHTLPYYQPTTSPREEHVLQGYHFDTVYGPLLKGLKLQGYYYTFINRDTQNTFITYNSYLSWESLRDLPAYVEANVCAFISRKHWWKLSFKRMQDSKHAELFLESPREKITCGLLDMNAWVEFKINISLDHVSVCAHDGVQKIESRLSYRFPSKSTYMFVIGNFPSVILDFENEFEKTIALMSSDVAYADRTYPHTYLKTRPYPDMVILGCTGSFVVSIKDDTLYVYHQGIVIHTMQHTETGQIWVREDLLERCFLFWGYSLFVVDREGNCNKYDDILVPFSSGSILDVVQWSQEFIILMSDMKVISLDILTLSLRENHDFDGSTPSVTSNDYRIAMDPLITDSATIISMDATSIYIGSRYTLSIEEPQDVVPHLSHAYITDGISTYLVICTGTQCILWCSGSNEGGNVEFCRVTVSTPSKPVQSLVVMGNRASSSIFAVTDSTLPWGKPTSSLIRIDLVSGTLVVDQGFGDDGEITLHYDSEHEYHPMFVSLYEDASGSYYQSLTGIYSVYNGSIRKVSFTSQTDVFEIPPMLSSAQNELRSWYVDPSDNIYGYDRGLFWETSQNAHTRFFVNLGVAQSIVTDTSIAYIYGDQNVEDNLSILYEDQGFETVVYTHPLPLHAHALLFRDASKNVWITINRIETDASDSEVLQVHKDTFAILQPDQQSEVSQELPMQVVNRKESDVLTLTSYDIDKIGGRVTYRFNDGQVVTVYFMDYEKEIEDNWRFFTNDSGGLDTNNPNIPDDYMNNDFQDDPVPYIINDVPVAYTDESFSVDFTPKKPWREIIPDASDVLFVRGEMNSIRVIYTKENPDISVHQSYISLDSSDVHDPIVVSTVDVSDVQEVQHIQVGIKSDEIFINGDVFAMDTNTHKYVRTLDIDNTLIRYKDGNFAMVEKETVLYLVDLDNVYESVQLEQVTARGRYFMHVDNDSKHVFVSHGDFVSIFDPRKTSGFVISGFHNDMIVYDHEVLRIFGQSNHVETPYGAEIVIDRPLNRLSSLSIQELRHVMFLSIQHITYTSYPYMFSHDISISKEMIQDRYGIRDIWKSNSKTWTIEVLEEAIEDGVKRYTKVSLTDSPWDWLPQEPLGGNYNLLFYDTFGASLDEHIEAVSVDVNKIMVSFSRPVVLDAIRSTWDIGHEISFTYYVYNDVDGEDMLYVAKDDGTSHSEMDGTTTRHFFEIQTMVINHSETNYKQIDDSTGIGAKLRSTPERFRLDSMQFLGMQESRLQLGEAKIPADFRNSLYYTTANPFFTLQSPSESGYNSYSFSLYPSYYQPSGYYDLSVTTNFLHTKLHTEYHGDLYILSKNYNMITQGEGILMDRM